MPYLETGPGLRLFYTVTGPGSAPALVFSNSLGTTHRMWDAIASELSAEYRCVRYDTRGHGGSNHGSGPFEIADLADDLAALLDHLDLPCAHVAGLSLGGMIGQAFAARHPARLAGLTLMATTAYMPTREAWEERAGLVRRDGTQAILAATMQRWFTPGFRAAHHGAADAVAEEFAAIDRDGYAACCEAIGRMDLRPLLHRVNAPTTVIAGREDPATPVAMAEALHTGIAGSRLVLLSPAAHLLAIEQAERVAAELRRDLSRSYPQKSQI